MVLARPRRSATLPADGIVLEEVIESMQQEYGTPSTPQEYRLIVKLPGPDAGAESSQEESGRGLKVARGRRGRLRRRGRRAGASGSEAAGADPVPEEGPDRASPDGAGELPSS